MARFLEILRCWGVDQSSTPYAGMVVPFNGENQVILETAGTNLVLQNSPLKIFEYDGEDLTRGLLRNVQTGLAEPHVDAQQKDAYMPSTVWNKPRFFRILGNVKSGFPGTNVSFVARSAGGRGTPSGAATTLKVVVLDRMTVKVAIRNVRARDEQGNMRYHAKKPVVDALAEVKTMNEIWTPQTNMAFELVPSSDIDVDHNDRTTRDELTQAYGMKMPATFTAESTIRAEKNSGWFAKHKVPGTHMTFFVVHKILSGGSADYGRGGEFPNGTMNRTNGVSFIADSRLTSTFAHEAGHWIGDIGHTGQDYKLLMRGEGAGYKIPFDLAKHFRETFPKRPRP